MKNSPSDLDLDPRSIRPCPGGHGGSHRLNHQGNESRSRISRQDQPPLPGQPPPLRKMPRNQPILPGHVTDPRARRQTLRYNPGLEIIRLFSPGIWWSGFRVKRSGSEVQHLQMNS